MFIISERIGILFEVPVSDHSVALVSFVFSYIFDCFISSNLLLETSLGLFGVIKFNLPTLFFEQTGETLQYLSGTASL